VANDTHILNTWMIVNIHQYFTLLHDDANRQEAITKNRDGSTKKTSKRNILNISTSSTLCKYPAMLRINTI